MLIGLDPDAPCWASAPAPGRELFLFAPFAPADEATSEDHGYLISFVRNETADQSEVHIFDAQDIEVGPICKLILPCRVPEGFHATWARGDLLQALVRPHQSP